MGFWRCQQGEIEGMDCIFTLGIECRRYCRCRCRHERQPQQPISGRTPHQRASLQHGPARLSSLGIIDEKSESLVEAMCLDCQGPFRFSLLCLSETWGTVYICCSSKIHVELHSAYYLRSCEGEETVEGSWPISDLRSPLQRYP